MVVDCKPLADILSGRAVLTDVALRPASVRHARFIAKLCQDGRRPRVDFAPYVEWRPGRFNPVADFLCKFVMDRQASAEDINTAEVLSAVAHRLNLHLCSDGGLRPGSCGATGWILYSVKPCGEQLLWSRLAWRTMFLDVSIAHSSIQREAVALEDGVNFLTSFYSKSSAVFSVEVVVFGFRF